MPPLRFFVLIRLFPLFQRFSPNLILQSVSSIAPLNLDGLVIMLNNNVRQVTNIITTQEDLDDILFLNTPATEYEHNDACNNSIDVLVMQ